MDPRFQKELEQLKVKVLQMAAYTDRALEKALGALLNRDVDLARQVIDADREINAMECEVDTLCLRLLALDQPVAMDLRFIVSCMRMVVDLERIGDEAEKIGRMAKLIHEAQRQNMPDLELRHVADLAIGMLRKSLDAFARLDSSAASAVVRQDELVDNEFRSILRQLITFMMEDPRTITRSLEILFVAKALERIGDHSKNMAEYVVYMVEGRDVRHIRDNSAAKTATVDPLAT